MPTFSRYNREKKRKKNNHRWQIIHHLHTKRKRKRQHFQKQSKMVNFVIGRCRTHCPNGMNITNLLVCKNLISLVFLNKKLIIHKKKSKSPLWVGKLSNKKEKCEKDKYASKWIPYFSCFFSKGKGVFFTIL